MTLQTESTIEHTDDTSYGGQFPVPVVTTAVKGLFANGKTHGRMMDSEDHPECITWCGKHVTIGRFGLRGRADKVAAIDCKSCQRSRWAATFRTMLAMRSLLANR